jgi:chemotaxis protein MotA
MIGVFGYLMQGSTVGTLINLHSLVLVVVGTGAILAVTSPKGELMNLMKALLTPNRADEESFEIQTALLTLTKNRFAQTASAHPLIQYAQVLWEQGVDDRLFKMLLRQRALQLQQQDERSVLLLRNLAKYPPALGMTGTVLGLVSLFSSFSADARSNIGPALALAMTATFYGLILANAFVMPFADRLHGRQVRRSNINEQVLQTLFLIHEGQPEVILEDRNYA